jgi:hypothetical protein
MSIYQGIINSPCKNFGMQLKHLNLSSSTSCKTILVWSTYLPSYMSHNNLCNFVGISIIVWRWTFDYLLYKNMHYIIHVMIKVNNFVSSPMWIKKSVTSPEVCNIIFFFTYVNFLNHLQTHKYAISNFSSIMWIKNLFACPKVCNIIFFSHMWKKKTTHKPKNV